MNEECLVCSALLRYLDESVEMECSLCHKREPSRTSCINGHYVCDDCHTKGIDAIFRICIEERSASPAAIAEKLMSLPSCHMHGPEHHVIVGAALLTAYRNAGGKVDLRSALAEMLQRGGSVPGGVCGFWGACGAGVSSGIFVAIVTGSTPLATEAFGLANLMTARSLEAIGRIGGPRCCKRDSYLAILQAVDFVRERLHVSMDREAIACSRSERNNQCLRRRCPFFAGERARLAPSASPKLA